MIKKWSKEFRLPVILGMQGMEMVKGIERNFNRNLLFQIRGTRFDQAEKNAAHFIATLLRERRLGHRKGRKKLQRFLENKYLPLIAPFE